MDTSSLIWYCGVCGKIQVPSGVYPIAVTTFAIDPWCRCAFPPLEKPVTTPSVSDHPLLLRATDPSKKSGVIARLLALWQRHTDLRLGQLLVNAFGNDRLYFIEDFTLIEGLETFYRQEEKNGKTSPTAS